MGIWGPENFNFFQILQIGGRVDMIFFIFRDPNLCELSPYFPLFELFESFEFSNGGWDAWRGLNFNYLNYLNLQTPPLELIQIIQIDPPPTFKFWCGPENSNNSNKSNRESVDLNSKYFNYLNSQMGVWAVRMQVIQIGGEGRFELFEFSLPHPPI